MGLLLLCILPPVPFTTQLRIDGGKRQYLRLLHAMPVSLGCLVKYSSRSIAIDGRICLRRITFQPGTSSNGRSNQRIPSDSLRFQSPN